MKDIASLIGECTAYDKKVALEAKKPRSWLKSISAFANGDGGALIFGIADNDEVVGLADAKHDSEIISQAIRDKMDPIPDVALRFEDVNGKQLIVVEVKSGRQTPYYYVADGNRVAYIRVGNESIPATNNHLFQLMLKGSGRSYDSLPSTFAFEKMAFTKLRSISNYRVHRDLLPSDFESWGLIDSEGHLTNAGALLADESPVRHSRIFCTRWGGMDKAGGLMDAIDDAEFSGSLINQLQDTLSFIGKHTYKAWRKLADRRQEFPDYPERAVEEALVNAIIHRDYTELGSEVHVDIYDNRMEIYSPGGMFEGRPVQDLDIMTIPSRRRNPILADIFNRLEYMERRGSGFKKILQSYAVFGDNGDTPKPEFRSTHSSFFITLWNLNYSAKNVVERVVEDDTVNGPVNVTDDTINDTIKGTDSKEDSCIHKTINDTIDEPVNDTVNGPVNDTVSITEKQLIILKSIQRNPSITIDQIGTIGKFGRSTVKRHLKHLQNIGFIQRVGSDKTGHWEILRKI